MTVFLIISCILLWGASLWCLYGRQSIAPALSYMALLVLSFITENGYPVLPLNGTILTGWLCIDACGDFHIHSATGAGAPTDPRNVFHDHGWNHRTRRRAVRILHLLQYHIEIRLHDSGNYRRNRIRILTLHKHTFRKTCRPRFRQLLQIPAGQRIPDSHHSHDAWCGTRTAYRGQKRQRFMKIRSFKIISILVAVILSMAMPSPVQSRRTSSKQRTTQSRKYSKSRKSSRSGKSSYRSRNSSRTRQQTSGSATSAAKPESAASGTAAATPAPAAAS